MPKDIQKELERIRKLRPIDDEFMRCIFRDKLELTQEVLRIILGIDDLVLEYAETNVDLKRLGKARSVVLDVYGRDSKGRVYNIEIERQREGADVKRACYYSSALDIEELNQGDEFSALTESYVIFIVEHDPFGEGKGIYHFKRQEIDNGKSLGDGTHILYVNAQYNGKDKLGDLMHDFLCSDPQEMKIKALAMRAAEFKQDERGVEKMGWFTEEIRTEALEEGRAEGRTEGSEKTFFNLVNKGLLQQDTAAKELNLTHEEFIKRAKDAGYTFV